MRWSRVLLCSCCLFVGPYSTRSKLELKIATSTFEWEATTFCRYEIEPKGKTTKTSRPFTRSLTHWPPFLSLYWSFFSTRSNRFAPSSTHTLCPAKQNDKQWHNFKKLPNQDVALRGMFQASLSEYVSRASLQKDQHQESLSGVCFDESLSPKSKIPAILKVGTSATKNTLPETNRTVLPWKLVIGRFILSFWGFGHFRPIFRGEKKVWCLVFGVSQVISPINSQGSPILTFLHPSPRGSSNAATSR